MSFQIMHIRALHPSNIKHMHFVVFCAKPKDIAYVSVCVFLSTSVVILNDLLKWLEGMIWTLTQLRFGDPLLVENQTWHHYLRLLNYN